MAVKTIRDPRARYSPPKMSTRSPIPPTIDDIFMSCFFGIFLSSTFMNCDTKTELKKMATKREEPRTTDSVMGKYFINCPMSPGHKPSGIKAATVVAVEIIIGKAISPIPRLAASTRDMPSSSMRRYTFSTTTIPLSTSIPSPMMSPNKIIVFMV